jgi:hypothetical protein
MNILALITLAQHSYIGQLESLRSQALHSLRKNKNKKRKKD